MQMAGEVMRLGVRHFKKAYDASDELRILTNGYNAEYGRGAGGVVNVTMKSGTNDLHGSARATFAGLKTALRLGSTLRMFGMRAVVDTQ